MVKEGSLVPGEGRKAASSADSVAEADCVVSMVAKDAGLLRLACQCKYTVFDVCVYFCLFVSLCF